MRWTEVEVFSLASLARAVASGVVSPVEVTEACLERIHELDGRLNSFVTVTEDRARADAQRAEGEVRNGHYRGLLHGVPIAIKDIFMTRGIRTTAGSRVLRDWIPDEDAATVRRLTDAGAVLMGKLNMSEFAYGSIHPDFGAPRNPWNLDRFTGGSSSGSGAAVASSLCFGSFGTDTGGSIRGPAAHCGIVGFKPTYDAVSRSGVIPLSWSLDHVGPMARTVEDAAILFGAVAGGDWVAPVSGAHRMAGGSEAVVEGLRGEIGHLRLGVATAYLDQEVQPDVSSAVRSAIAVLGSTMRSTQEVALPDDAQVVAAWFSICMPEATAYHAGTMAERLQDYGEPLQDRLLAGLGVSAAQYLQALRVRRVIAQQFADLFRQVDLIVLPTMLSEAPTLESAVAGSWAGLRARIRSVAAFNLAGLPAITVPCGLTSSGLPVGLQIVGASHADWTVLRAGFVFEQTAGWEKAPKFW